jgi:enamine deaminase RidA (YjgF/YER057c/UK114 family)
MKRIAIAVLATLTLVGGAQAAVKHSKTVTKTVVAHAAPKLNFIYSKPDAFIATGVVVPAGWETFYVSGIPSNVVGGTEAQTTDVLTKLGEVLKAQGYGFGDVVNVKVYLVGDTAKDGKLDFVGMNTAFKKVFGPADQPNRPSRVTVQVAGLALPGALVEIELTAAKAPK